MSAAAFIAMGFAVFILDETGWFLSTPIPVLNDHPTDLLRLSGSIPDGFSVQVVTRYQTTNPKYQVSANWLENFGTYAPRVVNIDTPVEEKTGTYETNVPLDRFKPGDAQWAPDCVFLSLRASGTSPRPISPAIDSREGIFPAPLLICFNPPRQLPLNVPPYTYGSDWTSLVIPCRFYKGSHGEPEATTDRTTVVYFPLTNAVRDIRGDFVPWKQGMNTISGSK
jgi:hypothetical protein